MVVLISGGGTTLRNLLAKIAAGELPAQVARVVSSNPRAGGLAIAAEAGIPMRTIERRTFADDQSFGAAVFAACREVQSDLVVMGGFLKFAPCRTISRTG